VKQKRRGGGLKRRRSAPVIHREEALLPHIPRLKAEHPCWGARSIWASRRFVEPLVVNKKRMLRLRREHHVGVSANPKLKAKRTPKKSTPRPIKPTEWWGIDMTKVVVEGFGWISIVIVLDWYSKKIVGYDTGTPCPAQPWLPAVDMAVNRPLPHGARGQELSRMCDNGCQPTAAAFMKACSAVGVRQAVTSDNNPKGHADPERVIRTLKEEGLWLKDWTSPFELRRALEGWLADDHAHDLPSALGYKTPEQGARDYHNSHSPPFVAA
jgi:putative transposase